MKKRMIFEAVIALLFVLAPQLFAQYNRDAVVKVMRNNVVLMGQINTAVASEDFYTAAARLMELAQGFKSLDAVSPPKGSKAEWDSIHAVLIRTAFRAIGACGEQNVEKLKGEIANIWALNKEGHSKFRS